MDAMDHAREEAERARHQLEGTAQNVKMRLRPAALAGEIKGRAKAKVVDLAHDAADAARARPALVTWVIAGLAFLLFRKPVASVIQRLQKDKRNG
jgi:hypothetical protein